MLILLAQTTTAPQATEHSFLFHALLSGIYGIVEGLTEFLPVSSTAHLRIAENLTGISLESGYWKMYSVVIQLGAILSVPILFRDRILKLVQTFPMGQSPTPSDTPPDSSGTPDYAGAGVGPRPWYRHPLSLVMIAFVVTAGPCYLADKFIGKTLESLLVMGLALIIGGIVMWCVDFFCTPPRSTPKTNRMEEMSVLDAIWIGIVQILSAIFPGTSRSMSTIAAGQVFGLSRPAALEFSFFLSIPTMFAATGYKLLQAVVHHKTAEELAAYNAPHHPWLVLAIGFVVSFIVAFAVNGWFIQWVRTRGFAPFAVYRILLGAGLLAWIFMH